MERNVFQHFPLLMLFLCVHAELRATVHGPRVLSRFSAWRFCWGDAKRRQEFSNVTIVGEKVCCFVNNHITEFLVSLRVARTNSPSGKRANFLGIIRTMHFHYCSVSYSDRRKVCILDI